MAVMRNEWDLVLPWVAHHLVEGFDSICITDNRSTDGTRELLEGLAESGWITLLYEDGEQLETQDRTYAAMTDRLRTECDVIAVVDADELLVSHDDATVGDHLRRLFGPSEVGAVAINWRIFGSAGRRLGDAYGMRATSCAKPWHTKHHHIKTVARASAVEFRGTHHVRLRHGFRYLHVDGTDVNGFCEAEPALGGPITPEPQGQTARIVMAPVTVHHHILTSTTAFQLGKAARPRAAGTVHPSGWEWDYFQSHDLNEDTCDAEGLRASEVAAVMNNLILAISESRALLPAPDTFGSTS